jgi:hypothetical protein
VPKENGGDFQIDGRPYDLAKGTLFLVSTKASQVRVTQLDVDLSKVQTDKQGFEAFAEDQPKVAEFVAEASGQKARGTGVWHPFSPDGLRPTTGGSDHGVLTAEVPRIPEPKGAKVPSAAELDNWWTALGGDAEDAYAAMRQMLDAPDHAVALLKDQIRPVPGDLYAFFERHLQLHGESLGEREKARDALEKTGEASALAVRHHRAVVALERIGTPAARALLRALADGFQRARLTIEARAALKRLDG